MAFTTTLIDDLKRILILVFVASPLTASANIDCDGKSFHCLNSTHFMICVDLGGGRSSTVDDFVIPCPPPTVCQGNNRFECEFPPSTPAPILVTTASDVTNNAITSDATVAWEEINITSTMYETVSKEERLESSPVSLTEWLHDSVTTELIPTKQLVNIEINVNTTENNFTTTTAQSPTTESVSAINNTTGKVVSSEPRVEINTVSLTTSLNDSVTTELIPTEQINNIEVTSAQPTENNVQTSFVIESVSTGQIDDIDIKANSPRSNFTAATESLNTASTVVNGTPSINNAAEKAVNHQAGLEIITVSSMTSINNNDATELIPTKQFEINATENKFTTSTIEFLTTDFPTVSTIHSINNVTEKTVNNEAVLEIVSPTTWINDNVTKEQINNIDINVNATENKFTTSTIKSLNTDSSIASGLPATNKVTEKAVINVTGLEKNKVISTITLDYSVTTELIPTEQINKIGINVKATENNFTTTNTDSELMTIDGISAINNVTEKVVSNETRLEITTDNLTTSLNDSVTIELISSGQINNIEINVNATENYLKTTAVIESVSTGQIDTLDIKANEPRNNFIAATESQNTASIAVNGLPSINNVTEKLVNPEAGLEVNTVSSTTSINDNVTTKLISTAPIYDIETNVNATENNFSITVATESVSAGQIDSDQININETETEFTTTTLESLTTKFPTVNDILATSNVIEKPVNSEVGLEINAVSSTTLLNDSLTTELIPMEQIDNIAVKANAMDNIFLTTTTSTEFLTTEFTAENGVPAVNHVTEKAISNKTRPEIKTVTLTTLLEDSVTNELIQTEQINNINLNTTENNFTTTLATELILTGQIENIEVKANATGNSVISETESIKTASTDVNGILTINNVTENAVNNEGRYEITTVSSTKPFNYSVAAESVSTGQIDNMEIKEIATESNFDTATESLNTKSITVNGLPAINNFTEKAIINKGLFEITTASLTKPLNYSTVKDFISTRLSDNIEIKANVTDNNFTTTVATEFVSTSQIAIKANATDSNFTATTESSFTESMAVNDVPDINKMTERSSSNGERFEVTTVSLTTPLNYSVATESVSTGQTDNIKIKANATENKFTTSFIESLINDSPILNHIPNISNVTEKVNTTLIGTKNVTNNDVVNKETITNLLENNITDITSLTETTSNLNFNTSTKHVTTPNILITSTEYGFIVANTNANLEVIKTDSNKEKYLNSISTTADMFTTSISIQNNSSNPEESVTFAGNVTGAHQSATEPYNAIPVTNENTSIQNISEVLEPYVVYATLKPTETTTQVSEDVDATFNIFTRLESTTISGKMVMKTENNLLNEVITATDNISAQTSTFMNTANNISVTEKTLISKELTTGAHSTIDFSGTAHELKTSSSLLEPSINVSNHAMTTAAVDNNTVITTEKYSLNNIDTNTTAVSILQMTTDLPSVKVVTTETLPEGITLPRNNTMEYINHNNFNINSSSIPQIIKENGIKNHTTNLFGSDTTINTSDFEEIVNNTETVSLKSQNLQTAVVPTYYTTLPVAQYDTTKILSITTNQTLKIKSEEIISNTLIPDETIQRTILPANNVVHIPAITAQFQEISQAVTENILSTKMELSNQNITTGLESVFKDSDLTYSPEKKSHTVMSTKNVERALDTTDLAPSALQKSELLQIEKNGVTTTSSTISSDYIVTPQTNLQGSMYTTKIEMSTYTVTKQEAIIGDTQYKDEINPSSLKQYSDYKMPDQVFTEKLVSIVTTPATPASAKGFSNGVSIYPESILKHSTTQAPLLKSNSYPKITTSVTSGKGKSLDILAQNTMITHPQFSTTVKSIETNGYDRKIMPVEKTEILPITTPVLTVLEVMDTTTTPSVNQTPELSGHNFVTDNHSIIDFNTETISESVIQNRHLSEEIPASSTIASEFLSMNINETLSNSTQNKVVITESGQGYTEIVNTENAAVDVGTNLSNNYQQNTSEDKVKEDKETHTQLSQTNRKPSSTNAHQFINNTDKRTDMLTPHVVSDAETTKNDSLAQVEVITNISPSQKLTFKPSVVTFSITESTPSISTTVSQLNQFKFDCRHRKRGRYADNEDCRKFYTCVGLEQPIFGFCPVNTVFSDIKKQCTKNLSHCIRDNQFKCVSEGRFVDFKENNVYYICVKNNLNSFVKFKFICQNGYYLDKASVRCVWNQEPINQSVSNDSISKSTPDKKSKEDEKPKKKEDRFECEEEGKFADPRNCRKFYICSKSSKSDEFRKRRKKCDRDEVFHKNKKKCVDAESHECS